MPARSVTGVRRAVVLAAGQGTRLRPFTLTTPKALVPIAGIPLLDHLLCLLANHGVQEVAINLHHLPDAILDFIGDGKAWGMRAHVLHEEHLLGSGGTLRALRWFLREPFLLMYGDVLTDVDLGKLVADHMAFGADLTCLLHRVADPWTKGVADLAPDGRLRRFVEKPRRGDEPGDCVAAGVYVASPAVVAVVPPHVPCDFGADVLPALLAAHMPVYGAMASATSYIRDIGTLAALAAAEADVANGRVRLCSRTRRRP